MQYLNLRPSQVLLDRENPRLPDGTTNDREAINRLLTEGAEALINLARDMAKLGQANPSELPIAMKSGRKYLVLEGNRRFAALKLLRDPTLADSVDHQLAFRRAAQLGDPPRSIHTVVLDDREAAEHWIVLRHTGDNAGRGVRRWSAGQAAIHRRRANRTIDSGTRRSMVISDELQMAYETDTDLLTLIQKVDRDKLTNIGRLFSADILRRLSLSVRKSSAPDGLGELWSEFSKESLRDFFSWAFELIDANSVDAYKNEDIRKKALNKALAVIPSDQERLAAPVRLAQQDSGEIANDAAKEQPTTQPESNSGSNNAATSGGAGDPSTSGSAGSRDPAGGKGALGQGATGRPSATGPQRREARPERFLFQDLRLPNHLARIQQLLKECRSIVIDDQPGVACVMARVLVELSVSAPGVLQLTGCKEGDRLQNKILATLRHLDPDIEHPMKRDKELAQAFMETTTLGVQYLNGFVHNPAVIPDGQLARRFSAAYRPLLFRVDGTL